MGLVSASTSASPSAVSWAEVPPPALSPFLSFPWFFGEPADGLPAGVPGGWPEGVPIGMSAALARAS
ncbi:hypothetical protein ADK38_09070 [Streptomyces varsoviensis]|uniref:Secreted protein n=1 Tax=Streptomyces varsoviensis TaxID=67373 RepID=A0ABR5JAQ0_9ACTN|nr:hypothetical protein ADK38_09070 [Streptomyces varsoviensis]